MRGGATGARVGSPGVRDGGEISDPTDSSGLSGLPPGAEQRRSDGLISIGYGSFLGLPPDVADRITRYNAAINDGQSPGPFIEFAQTGFQGIIRQPTTFQVGEGGFPEEVIVRPRRLGSLFEGGTDEDAGEAEGRRGDLNVRISIDLRGATGISASEVADATVEKLLDAVRDDLRYGEARQIIREEVID